MKINLMTVWFLAGSALLLANSPAPVGADEVISAEHRLLSEMAISTRNLDRKAERLSDIVTSLGVLQRQLDSLLHSTWEYKALRINRFGDFDKQVASLGREGWELVGVTIEEGFIFKRRIPTTR